MFADTSRCVQDLSALPAPAAASAAVAAQGQDAPSEAKPKSKPKEAKAAKPKEAAKPPPKPTPAPKPSPPVKAPRMFAPVPAPAAAPASAAAAPEAVPEDQRLAVGLPVEVMLLEEGMKGCWWNATVVEVHLEDGEVTIECVCPSLAAVTARCDSRAARRHADLLQEDEQAHLRERVSLPPGSALGARLPAQLRVRLHGKNKLPPPHVQQIRPRAPPAGALDCGWSVGDSVDGRKAADEGWWEGVIDKVSKDGRTVHMRLPDAEVAEEIIQLGEQEELRRTRVWTADGWRVTPSGEGPRVAFANQAGGGVGGADSAPNKEVSTNRPGTVAPPYDLPPDFDPAAVGIPPVDDSSKAAFDRTSSGALAARWAALREDIPPAARERYAPGEHMRGGDLNIFEQARAEVWHAHGAAAARLGLGVKECVTLGKRMIRVKGLLTVDRPEGSDSEDAMEEGDGAAAGGAESARARRASTAAAARGKRKVCDEAASGSEEASDDEDVELEEEEDELDERPAGGATSGRGRGGRRGGRGRGGGRAAAGRSAGGRGFGRGAASRPAVAALLEMHAADCAATCSAAAPHAHRPRGLHPHTSAGAALQRLNSLAAVSLAASPACACGSSFLAAGVRGGQLLLWRLASGCAPSSADAPTCLGACPPPHPPPGWPAALAWAPPGAGEALWLLSGGSCGDVTLWRGHLAGLLAAPAWALDAPAAPSAPPALLACAARLGDADGVPVSAAALGRTPGGALRLAVAKGWRLLIWAAPMASLDVPPAAAAAAVPWAAWQRDVPSSPAAWGLAWCGPAAGALCAADVGGALHVWAFASVRADAAPAAAYESQSPEGERLPGSPRYGSAHGLALSPHGLVAACPRSLLSTGKAFSGALTLTLLAEARHSAAAAEPLNLPSFIAAAVAQRAPGALLWDVAVAMQRLAGGSGAGSEQALQDALEPLHSALKSASEQAPRGFYTAMTPGDWAMLRCSVALRRALGCIGGDPRGALQGMDLTVMEGELLGERARAVLIACDGREVGIRRTTAMRWATAVVNTPALSRPQLLTAAKVVLDAARSGGCAYVADACPLCESPLALGGAACDLARTPCRGPGADDAALHWVSRCLLTLAPRALPDQPAQWACPGCGPAGARGALMANADDAPPICPLCATRMHRLPLGAHASALLVPGFGV